MISTRCKIDVYLNEKNDKSVILLFYQLIGFKMLLKACKLFLISLLKIAI